MRQLKNSLIYTLGGFGSKAISLLMLPLFTRFLTPEDYGLLTVVTTVSMLIAGLASLQLRAGYARNLFDFKAPLYRQQLLETALSSLVVLNVTVVALCCLCQPVFGWFYPEIKFYPYFFITLLALPVSAVLDVMQVHYRMTEQPGKFVLLSWAQIISGIFFSVLFVVVIKWHALGMCYAGLAAGIVSFVIAVWSFPHRLRWYFENSQFRGMFRYGLQVIPYTMITIVITNVDRFLINRYATLAELGLFGVALRLASAFRVFGDSAEMTFTPYFFRLASQHRREDIACDLGCKATWVMAVFIFLGTCVMLVSSEVVLLILPSKYQGVGGLLPWLVLAAVFNVIDSLGAIGAQFVKKMIAYTPICLAAGVLNLALDLLLLPRLGARGAAMAAAAGALLMMLLRIAYSQRVYAVGYQWGRLLLCVGASCLVLAIGSVCSFMLPVWSALVSKLMLMAVLGVAISSFMSWWHHWQTLRHAMVGMIQRIASPIV